MGCLLYFCRHPRVLWFAVGCCWHYLSALYWLYCNFNCALVSPNVCIYGAAWFLSEVWPRPYIYSFIIVPLSYRRDIVAWYSKWLQHISVICRCFGQAYQPRLECLKTCPEGEGTQCTELTEHRAMAATAWQLWAASLPCCCVPWDWDLSLLNSVESVESVESPTSRPMQPISRLRLR